MERQLKERLIGAAVLVAVAVIMVPEMFSGPHSHPDHAADVSSASSEQVKTYHIELQSAHSADAAPPTAVEAPAPQPKEEAQLPSTASAVAESSVSTSALSSNSSSPRTEIEPATVVAKPVAKPAPVPVAVAAPSKEVPTAKPAEAEWVVQVGSFATQDKARLIVGKLKEQGFSAYVGKVTVGGKTLFRVRVGAASARPAAEATLRKLKATYPGASVVPANR